MIKLFPHPINLTPMSIEHPDQCPQPVGKINGLKNVQRRITCILDYIFENISEYPKYHAIIAIENFLVPHFETKYYDQAIVVLHNIQESIRYQAFSPNTPMDRRVQLESPIRQVIFQIRQHISLISKVKSSFIYHENFPQNGVNFMDFSNLFLDTTILDNLIDYLADKYRPSILSNKPTKIDYVFGLESRGYLIALPLALKLGAGFVPIRKAGKLPQPKASSQLYQKEYGKDQFEVRSDLPTGKVLVVDDILATGGSLKAAIDLVTQTLGHHLIDAIVIRDVPIFRNRAHELLDLEKNPIRRVIME